MRSNLFSFKLLYSHYLTKFHQEHVQSWHKLGHPPCHICVPCKMIWIHEWWKSQWENIVTVNRLIHFWLICFIISLSLLLSLQQWELQIWVPRLSLEANPNAPPTTPKLSGHQGYLITGPNYGHVIGMRQYKGQDRFENHNILIPSLPRAY